MITLQFDSLNHSNSSGAYYCEVLLNTDIDIISTFLSAVGTDIALSDGVGSALLPFTQNQWTKIGVSYSALDSLMELNVDGVTSQAAYSGTLTNGLLTLLGSASDESRIRNVRRYDYPTYAENKAKIDELMA